MERVKVLSELRKPEMTLPEDFMTSVVNSTTRNLTKLLNWLLQHEADKRPSADELLRSDLLPPIEMQHSDFQVNITFILHNITYL